MELKEIQSETQLEVNYQKENPRSCEIEFMKILDSLNVKYTFKKFGYTENSFFIGDFFILFPYKLIIQLDIDLDEPNYSDNKIYKQRGINSLHIKESEIKNINMRLVLAKFYQKHGGNSKQVKSINELFNKTLF